MRIALALVFAASLTGCATADQIIRDATTAASTAAGSVEITAASWETNAVDLRGRGGTFAYDCPPNPSREARTAWGSGPYTDDSSVCTAGVHAGAITYARGGRVRITPRPGQNRYVGSARNDVETSDYGAWQGSFAIVR